LYAQDATPDRGVSYGYFPCAPDAQGGWLPSYPETTGYIIPTLLEFARRWERPEVRERAIEMALWEAEVQMPTGAVQSGRICKRDQQVAASFNTGMVLHGYTAAYRESRENRFLAVGLKAADFLMSDLSPDGFFRTHGSQVMDHRIKTYESLCAWALYRFGEDAGDARYKRAALRAVEGALSQQQANGWFANCCLTRPEAPLVHTIAYTLQGILEVGILSEREDLIRAVRRGLDPMLDRVSSLGFLPGRFRPNWQPAVFSSCLTGSAQVAIICYRLFETLGIRGYGSMGNRLLNHLKALQMCSSDPGIHGALPGSFPILGSYMRGGYPNWATKYLLDALLMQERLASR
jgi:hypothetical protein